MHKISKRQVTFIISMSKSLIKQVFKYYARFSDQRKGEKPDRKLTKRFSLFGKTTIDVAGHVKSFDFRRCASLLNSRRKLTAQKSSLWFSVKNNERFDKILKSVSCFEVITKTRKHMAVCEVDERFPFNHDNRSFILLRFVPRFQKLAGKDISATVNEILQTLIRTYSDICRTV